MNEQLANSGEHLTETATTLQKQIPEILKRDDLTSKKLIGSTARSTMSAISLKD